MLSKVASARERISCNVVPNTPRQLQQDKPKLWNLAPNPSFEQTAGQVVVAGLDHPCAAYRQPYADGGVYTHSSGIAYSSDSWSNTGQRSLCVVGIDGTNDVFVAPGGFRGSLRLNMKPGTTYTAGVTVRLDRTLQGPLHKNALSLIAAWELDDSSKPIEKSSCAAPNRPGESRLSVTFTVPRLAIAAWVKLVSGASYGAGPVWWDSFYVVESTTSRPYFDGSSAASHEYSFGWQGEAHASQSFRVLKTAPQSPQKLAQRIKRSILDKEFVEAGYLLDVLLASNPDSIWGTAARAKVYEKQSRPDLAVSYYQRSLKEDPNQPEVHFRLGRLYESMRQTELAVDQLRIAVRQDPNHPNWFYKLGSLLDQGLDKEERKNAYKQAIAIDPKAPNFGLEMFSNETRWIRERFKIVNFLRDNLSQIKSMAGPGSIGNPSLADDFPIFMYWGQGFDHSPRIAQWCREQLLRNEQNTNIHFLDDSNINYYVDIPATVYLKTKKYKAHFSDVLRLALLERYGGVWMDATCFASASVRDWIPEVSKSGFFAFTRSGLRISNWLLASHSQGYIVSMMKAALCLYWEEYDSPIQYFLFHHIFEGLYRLDSDFANAWDLVPNRNANPPHRLGRIMLDEYDALNYDALTADSPVHKLKHKYSDRDVSSRSYLAHMLRNKVIPS